MPMPNFLIIGAGRSGTTSLYFYLKQHPEIYMPSIKETRFFIYEGQEAETKNHFFPNDIVTNLKVYKGLFSNVINEKAIGEASVEYLYKPRACERIKHYLPNIKLIVGLRNPADRAFSYFSLMKREGLEVEPTLFKALEADQHRKKKMSYLNGGFYFEHLQRYLDNFEKKQVFIYLYEDFAATPQKVIKEIFEFLEVATDFIPDVQKKYNEGKIYKSSNGILQKMKGKILKLPLLKSTRSQFMPNQIKKLIKNTLENSHQKLSLDDSTRRQLIEIYREDIAKVQQLINRDLSSWLL